MANKNNIVEPVEDDAKEAPEGFSNDDAMLWKRRYETSVAVWNAGDHKEKCENIVKYLHNDFSFVPGGEEVFLNQFFISLKTLIPLVIAHNPVVDVSPENDIVYEYGQDGKPLMGADGQPIKHDITKTASTIQALLKKKLKTIDFKPEMRMFLRDAIVFNRGIFLAGHTLNAEYSGSFNQPIFHAYLKRVSPRKIKRQAGTTRIDEGTYCFYEYELPVSHLKKDESYDQALLEQCTQEILEDIKIEDRAEYIKDSTAGYYDDVKYVKLHNAYDFEDGTVLVFGKGCDKPLKKMKTDYSFNNPFIEFIPNETFQPDQKEPVSDLMMVENIVKKAQKIITKAIRHIENFNTGYNIERGALTLQQRKRIERSKDKSFWEFQDMALSGGKVQPRNEVSMGNEPFFLIQFLFDFVDKTLAVYNFQQGGGQVAQETATKTQAKVQTSQFKSGDMSDMFTDAVNLALDKYAEILIRTTEETEVVSIVGDAGEVEYVPFKKEDAQKGVFYCEIDLQSMGKVNEDVKIQQGLQFYNILKSDPDPLIQQRFDKLKLVEKIAKGLHLGGDGIIKKIPDTQGMDEQAFRDYLKQQMIKAQHETEQATMGARLLPPTPDDDDEIHLADHLGKAQQIKARMASMATPMQGMPADPEFQKAQMELESLLQHAQIHIDRKKQKDAINQRMSGVQQPEMPPQNIPNGGPMGAPKQMPVNPPRPGMIGSQPMRGP